MSLKRSHKQKSVSEFFSKVPRTDVSMSKPATALEPTVSTLITTSAPESSGISFASTYPVKSTVAASSSFSVSERDTCHF